MNWMYGVVNVTRLRVNISAGGKREGRNGTGENITMSIRYGLDQV